MNKVKDDVNILGENHENASKLSFTHYQNLEISGFTHYLNFKVTKEYR